MMKKKYLSLLLSLSSIFVAKPCADGEWCPYDYNGLILSQELINQPAYFPFLLNLGEPFYRSNDSTAVDNGNIKEWCEYLKIGYDDAHYLVFKATEAEIESLLKNKKIENEHLMFANNSFVNKHKEALNYLLLAKQLEPFMTILGDNSGSWYNYEDNTSDITNVPYTETTLDLQKRWKRAKDKEIKLRYGYQLVRLAHYYRKYDEATIFFDAYVSPLNYKPEMYYYALSQKAGALRGLDEVIKANSLFMEVFSHSQDLKETAVNSMRLNGDIDFEMLKESANTIDEKNDADLLVGFISFSNPLASASKIIKRSPNAIQAKVLVARAIAELNFDHYGYVANNGDRRYPILSDNSLKNLSPIINLIQRQAESPEVKNKNYWNITLAYLYFIAKQFDKAETYLARIDSNEKGYEKQKNMIASYIDVAKVETIDEESEIRFFEKYLSKPEIDGREVIINMLANRYYLQKEFAKSFMLQNRLNRLMDNPNIELLNEIEDFYNAPNKNKMTQYICDNFGTGLDDKSVSIQQLLYYIRGMAYLTKNDLEKAKLELDKSKLSRDTIPANIFGYNRIECFGCEDNMEVDYLNEFPFIKQEMNEIQLVDVLIQLEKTAKKDTSKAAKANYLLGNFFYNTSVTGYYRNFLRFGYEGSYRQYFFRPDNKNSLFTNFLYLNTIPTFYQNTTSIADSYLKRAYTLASGDEFKARIVFALSKCEQEFNYEKLSDGFDYWGGYHNNEDDWVMISKRKYFKEMMKYKHTAFFRKVQTNCLYFDYYVNHL